MDFDPICENVSWAVVRCDTALDRSGRDVVIVVAKMAYEVSIAGDVRRVLAPVRPARVLDPGGGLRFVDDFDADDKPGTDLGLVGSAHPPAAGTRAVRSAYAWLTVGDLRKVVTVFGPRVFVKGLVGVVPSDPAPFVEPVPLRFDYAYGGIDRSTRERCPENHIGRGFSSDPSSLIGTPAHQLEPVDEGKGAPNPAHGAFAPIPSHWEPRRSLAGTHDADWARKRAPVRPRDFDPRHSCWAVPGLWSKTPLRGDEPIEVGGVRPEGVWRFTLPRYEVSFASSLNGEKRPHPTHLDGILIDADSGVVELTWRAAIRLPRKWELLERIFVLGVGELPQEVIGAHRPAKSADPEN